MTGRLAHVYAIAAIGLLLTGCSAVPGMRFDGSTPSRESWLGTPSTNYDIIPITPRVLQQMSARDTRADIGQDNPSLDTALASYIYLVEPRDVLSITIWGGGDAAAAFAPVTTGGGGNQPGSTGSSAGQQSGFQVAPDGTIFFPYAGRVDVAGRTVDEIAKELARRIRPIVKDAQISVSVIGYNSQKYQLAGAVPEPKLYPITSVPVTVSQAISIGGGAASQGSSGISASGQGMGDLAHVIYIHNHQSHVLNIQAYYRYGDATQDRLVRSGDVIFVPNATSNQVHVLGEVKQPGNYSLPDGKLNLTQVLGNAGGLDLTSANPSRVFVFRGTYKKPKIYWLDATSPDAMLLGNKFELHPQDVVYVGTAGLVSWDRFLAQLLPTIQAIYFTRALTK